jgi:hypothetical protein
VTDDVRPITLRTLPAWAAWTLRHDRSSYRSGRRSLTPSRVAASVRPNLREPIFIIGAPRSGTTFLGTCIAALPGVSYHHEPVATKTGGRYVYEGRWGDARAARFFRLVYAWLMRIHLDGDLRFAEKTPSNAFIVPFLDRTFPDSRFIHIVRDGRDAALSHARTPWLAERSRGSGRVDTGGYAFGPYARFWVEPSRRAEFESTSDLHRAAWAWRRHTEAALEHGRGLGPERYLEVRYEDLVTSPVQEAERLLAFLCLDDPRSRSGLTDAVSAADARSIGGWRTQLSIDQIAVVQSEAGSLLMRLGYIAG